MLSLDSRVSCACSRKKDTYRLTHLTRILCRSPASVSVVANLRASPPADEELPAITIEEEACDPHIGRLAYARLSDVSVVERYVEFCAG